MAEIELTPEQRQKLVEINASHKASQYGHLYEDTNSKEYLSALATLEGLGFKKPQIKRVIAELRTGIHEADVYSAIRALQAGERENQGK